MISDERDKFYVLKIQEYCERIEESVARFGDSFEVFSLDADYRDAICMNIFQIGELSNQLSEEFKEMNNDLPWNQMYGIRNVLAHAYIKVDDAIIWDTVKNDIPKLKERFVGM